jgi:lysophospholipase L1-like esterase
MTDVFRVSLLGDSNTAMAYFQLWTDAYLTTRYPDTIIELDNRGISGDSIEGGLKRLDWDVYPSNPDAVIVCFGGNGMTEYVGTLTGTPVAEIVRIRKINWYLDSMKAIIEELQSKGIEVIISSPVCYDEWADSKSDNYKLVHVTYIEITQKLKEMAEQYNIDFVDMYNNMLPITKDYRENTGDYSLALMNSDRKHANMTGALAGAFAYAEDARWASELVASVEIDASAKTANAENADVSLEISSPKYVSYTYKPKAIPLPINDNYIKLLTYKTLDLNARNREIIKVTGLEEGEYSIRFDGKVVTNASAQQLSEGIDISALTTNPSQKTSAEIFEFLRSKETNVASDRAFYYAEKNYIRKNNLTHLTIDERVANFQEQLDKNLVSGYMVDVMKSYIKKKDEMKSYGENNAYYEFMARVKANVDAYSVEIIKK